MPKRDPYQVLGLDRNATDDDIKKAKNKLHLKWHPDRNKSAEAPAKFTEATESAELLLDKQKRAAYDRGGWDYVDHVGDMKHRQDIRNAPTAAPVKVTYAVTLRDMYNKDKLDIKVPVIEKRDGKTTKITRDLPLPMNQIQLGHTMVVQGMGNIEEGSIDGDIHIKFIEKADSTLDKFKIDDSDLIYERELSLGEIMGYKFALRHPSGKTLLIQSSQCITEPEGKIIIFKGYGLSKEPSMFDRETRGNLIVKLTTNVGNQLKKLSPKERQSFTQALQKIPCLATPVANIPSDAITIQGQTPEEFQRTQRSTMGGMGGHPLAALFGAMGGNPFGGANTRVVVNGQSVDPSEFFHS